MAYRLSRKSSSSGNSDFRYPPKEKKHAFCNCDRHVRCGKKYSVENAGGRGIFLTRELKAELDKIFVQDQKFKNLMITVLSFGFKYGIPADSDLVFDVRFLPNPYYVEGMRPLSGNDAPVRDYVMGFETAQVFAEKLEDMIRFLIPNYISEGKHQLIISIGCTGGKHRSVTLANELYRRLSNAKDYGIRIEHRDLEKDAIRKGI